MLIGMKRLLLPLLLFTSTLALAVSKGFTYQSLPWNSNESKTVAYLKNQGWDNVRVQGIVLNQIYGERQGGKGRDCQLVISYARTGLDGVTIVCSYGPLTNEQTSGLYYDERYNLSKKLGDPSFNSTTLQGGVPVAGWTRPGGSLWLTSQPGGRILWVYMSPSTSAESMAGLSRLR